MIRTAIALSLLTVAPVLYSSDRDSPFTMPTFPMPKLAHDRYGETRRIGFLGFMRELNAGGVHTVDDVDFFDSDYAVIESESLPTMAAWLETTCHSVGLDLPSARSGAYDGTVFARLLEVGTTLAAVRDNGKALAMPIGVMICKRRQTWGTLPGDGGRDAYVLIETDRGLLVYDPPTRQIVGLSQFPNTADILTIQF